MRISRALADLGAVSALSALLFATGIHLPLVGQAAIFLSAVPLIWFAARQGPASGALAALLAAALLLPALPPPATLIYALEHALPAPFLGWWLARARPLSRGAALAALVVTALVLGTAFFLAGGGGRDAVQLLEEQLRAAFAEMGEGAGGGAVPAPADLEQIFALVRRVLPALTLVGIYLECALTALLAARLLARAAAPVRQPDLAAFSLPERLVWVLIAALALAWVPVPEVRTVALNALLPLLFAYLLQGFSILLHLAARVGIGRLGRALGALAFAVSPWLLGLPLLVGALDFFVGFRARWPVSPGSAAPPVPPPPPSS
jgi:uncharacterized protein YybS (DUF2232 family)